MINFLKTLVILEDYVRCVQAYDDEVLILMHLILIYDYLHLDDLHI